MGQPTYSYRPDAIIEGMKAIQKAHNLIDTRLDNLELYAETKLVDWSGDAQEQYRVHKKAWDQLVDNMAQIMIQKAVPSLDNILQNYQATERTNALTWQNG